MIIKSPSECSPAELELFTRLAREGNEVQSAGLMKRVVRAKALAFFVEDGNTIGIAALKRPYESYKAGVFAKAKATQESGQFPYELGWVVIDEKHQGRKLSRVLVEAVLSKCEGRHVFATSATTRDRMHRTLSRFGFVRHGQEYPSSERDEQLFLFIRTDAKPPVAADAERKR